MNTALTERKGGVSPTLIKVVFVPLQCQSLSELSPGQSQPQQRLPERVEISCQERESLENACSRWFRSPAPLTAVKYKSRGRGGILSRELCFISVPFCPVFWGNECV